MKILICPDSFKGTLSAKDIIKIIQNEAEDLLPGCCVTGLPLADGGEGTMEILLDVLGGKIIPVPVHDPLMNVIRSEYALLDNGVAVIEMAKASGLPLVPEEKRNPEKTTTFGTGELIRDALDRGCRRFVIGLGGSATNDGGTGCVSALGVRFTDQNGSSLPPVGENLIRIENIDISGLHPAVRESEFIIMCDIDNPLTGERGATFVFSPQKGADQDMQGRLENGMRHYAAGLKKLTGTDPDTVPGSGAAGGLAAGLMAFLGGGLSSGISAVLDLTGFENKVQDTDLIITGEGRADSQSAHGKVLWGVGSMAKKYNIPAIALVGCLGDGYEELYECGIQEIMANKTEDMTLEYAIANTRELLAENARKALHRYL